MLSQSSYPVLRKNKAMRTRITSNFRPLLRALYLFLIAGAVLSGLPRNAQAQLYILTAFPLGGPNGVVSEYSTTGAVINANLITGLEDVTGLALSSNTLFVTYLPGPNFIGTVGKYDATTGGAINPTFITGLSNPVAPVVNGNNLLIANAVDPGTVSEYDATTGAVINANFIAGLDTPTGLALSRNNLFVSSTKLINGRSVFTVGKYNASTGAAINPSFIKGVTLLAAKGDTLFGVHRSGAIGTYDATTGALINANFIIIGPREMGPVTLTLLVNKLFLATGKVVNSSPVSKVGEYDAITGAVINARLITGLDNFIYGIAVKPED